MIRLIFLWSVALALLAPVYAASLTHVFDILHNSKQSIFRQEKVSKESGLNASLFTQIVDHYDRRNKAVFYQRYWVDTGNYRTNGPVILYIPGETDAEPYVSSISQTETRLMAENLGAVVVIIEHRYYGQSNPVTDLSSKNMIYLNLKNSLADLANFMKNVKIKIKGADLPPPPTTPWIVMGATYGGALSAWVKHEYPNLVFAAIASSASVEAKYYFWEYFEPIRQGAPPHCRDSIINTVKYVDRILFSNNKKKIQNLKARFGLPNVTHNDDFASALITPIWSWQSIGHFTVNQFAEFCGYFAKANTVPAQITAYASYITKNLKCPDQDECFGTYNPKSPHYTDIDLSNAGRSWAWQSCYEFGFWESAPPKGHPTLISRLHTPEYSERQCRLYFPDSILPRRPLTDKINKVYGGWGITGKNIFWINGQFDPWKEVSVNAVGAPKRVSTEASPDVVIKGGIYGWDELWKPYETKPIIEVHNEVITSLRAWLKEFHSKD